MKFCWLLGNGSLLFLDWEEQLEFWWQLLLAVQPVGKIYPSDPAIRMNRYPQSLNVIASVRSTSEVRQVKLDLVPAFVQPHGHGTDKRLNSGC